MTITVWEPPRRAVVRHTGKVVRGSGAFEVEDLGPDRSPRRLVGVGRPAARRARPAGLAARARPVLRPLVRCRCAGSPRLGRGRPRDRRPGRRAGRPAALPVGRRHAGLLAYHDDEWGRPLHGDAALFERVSLEAFQSGLSWLTILRKRPAFRAAFAGFDPAAVAAFGDADVERLMADAGIVRNRAKVAGDHRQRARRRSTLDGGARRPALVLRAGRRPAGAARPRPTCRRSPPSRRRWQRR